MQEFENDQAFINALETNPLFLGKVIVYNNPEAVAVNMISLGIIGTQAPAADLLEILTQKVDSLSAQTIFVILDVPYKEGGDTADYDEPLALHIADIEPQSLTWGTLFPSLIDYKHAWDEFHGRASKKTNLKAKKSGCGCKNCTGAYAYDNERSWYVILFLLSIILIVVMAKYWK